MSNSEFITFLAFVFDASDKCTSGHSQRVSNIAMLISLEFGMAQEQVEKIQLAGLVHDIGKMGIRESVLMKQDKLTKEEYYHISTHSTLGEYILRSAIDDEEILKIVRNHHERYNGKGYPDGLSGQQIPQGARILAVADTYDAMTSDRPYRKAVSHQVAIAELKKQAGIQLDPVVVNVFSQMVSGTNIHTLREQATATCT